MTQPSDLLKHTPATPHDGDTLASTHPSQDTLNLLALRRSTLAREMTDPGPNDFELQTLLRLAARVPDHGKLGPWRFLIFKDSAREKFGDAIAEIFQTEEPTADQERIEFERARFLRAPVVVAVVSKTQPHPKAPEWEQVLSCGAVCQNLLIAASASGFCSQWITEWLAYSDAVNQVLGLGDGERIAGYIYIGSSTNNPTERRRVDIGDRIQHWSPPA